MTSNVSLRANNATYFDRLEDLSLQFLITQHTEPVQLIFECDVPYLKRDFPRIEPFRQILEEFSQSVDFDFHVMALQPDCDLKICYQASAEGHLRISHYVTPTLVLDLPKGLIDSAKLEVQCLSRSSDARARQVLFLLLADQSNLVDKIDKWEVAEHCEPQELRERPSLLDSLATLVLVVATLNSLHSSLDV